MWVLERFQCCYTYGSELRTIWCFMFFNYRQYSCYIYPKLMLQQYIKTGMGIDFSFFSYVLYLCPISYVIDLSWRAYNYTHTDRVCCTCSNVVMTSLGILKRWHVIILMCYVMSAWLCVSVNIWSAMTYKIIGSYGENVKITVLKA